MSNPTPLTVQDLEGILGCKDPTGEKHPVVISPKCHPNAFLRAAFDAEGESLWIHCQCGNLVTVISITKSSVH